MLSRRATPAGLVIYQSQLLANLGVPHAFSTRVAGLDLTAPPATPVAPADHPYSRLLSAIDAPAAQVVWCRQVHGRQVTLITPANAHDHPEADGLATRHPNLALTIRVADCVPVLLAVHCGRQPIAVAAIHAGWRGLIAGILPQAVRTLRGGLPADPATRFVAAIGPCIGHDRFEVGPEVAEAFAAAGLAQAIHAPNHPASPAKPHIDLQAAAIAHLRAAGLTDADIDRSDLCTHRDQADFYSHRRDAGRTGRQVAIITLPKP